MTKMSNIIDKKVPQEIVFNPVSTPNSLKFEDDGFLQLKLLLLEKSKMKRTKTGCLCCRKRKKKCDEQYPECVGCKRNGLSCVWPLGRDEVLNASVKQRRLTIEKFKELNQKLMDSIDITPKPTSQPVIRKSDLVNVVDKNVLTEAHQDDQGTFVVSVSQNEPHHNSNNKLILKSPIIPQHFEIRESSIVSENYTARDLEESPSMDVENSPSSSSHSEVSTTSTTPVFIPVNVNAEVGDSLNLDPYMDFTLNKFRTWIPNVSLSTDDAFLYHLFVTEFMPAISPLHCHPLLSPGAIYIPQVIYSPVLREIFLSCGAVFLGNKIPDFREFAMQKYGNAMKLLQHSLKDDKNVKGDEDWLLVAVQSFCLLERSSGMLPTSTARHLGAFYKIWSKRLLLRKSVVGPVTGVERNLVESFIFNYSVTILMCQHTELARLLPSPFEIFNGKVFPDLKKPIYEECVVPWMNNPIVGSALDSFILAAKLSWLCRLCLPLDETNYLRCLELKREIDNLQPCILLKHLENAPNYILLRNNISVSVITARLANILVSKMLFPDITPSSDLIQQDVNIIIQELIKISICATECCLPYWAILVAGSATSNEDQLNFFKETNRQMALVLNSSVAIQLNKYLNRVWTLNLVKKGDGFECMFNTLAMDSLVV